MDITAHQVRDTTTAADQARRRLLAGVPVAERRLEPAGIPTAVLEGGDGPPLVLLHGAGEFAALWLPVVPELAAGHRVVAPDLPGHGASGMPPGPLDTARMLAWLGGLLEATCPAPPVLVGRGLGGALAARFAAAHGDRLERLVLVGSLGLAPFDPTPAFGLAMGRFAEEPTETTRDGLFRECFADLDGLAGRLGERWADLAAYALDRARTPAMEAAMGALLPELVLPPVPPAELDRIGVPTSLIWGRQDNQVRVAVAEAASARHGWPLRVIDGAGDDPPLERPAAFLAALDAVLAPTATAGGSGGSGGPPGWSPGGSGRAER
jgi:pimeloyl-ACP methyl ester carboxylesterase